MSVILSSCLILSLFLSQVFFSSSVTLVSDCPCLSVFPFLSLHTLLFFFLFVSLVEVPCLPIATWCHPVTLCLSRPPINTLQVAEWMTMSFFPPILHLFPLLILLHLPLLLFPCLFDTPMHTNTHRQHSNSSTSACYHIQISEIICNTNNKSVALNRQYCLGVVEIFHIGGQMGDIKYSRPRSGTLFEVLSIMQSIQ